MIATLPRRLPSPEGKPVPADDTAHVFRTFARDLAMGRRAWKANTARFVGAQFDQLAAGWDRANATGRDDPLRDALERCGSLPAGACLELGSGTGFFTPLLSSAFRRVISLDLSEQMLRQAAERSPWRVRADAGRLPIADGRLMAV